MRIDMHTACGRTWCRHVHGNYDSMDENVPGPGPLQTSAHCRLRTCHIWARTHVHTRASKSLGCRGVILSQDLSSLMCPDVSMHAGTNVCACYKRVCICAYTRVYVNMPIHIGLNLCAHVRAHACMHVWAISIYRPKCMSIRVPAHTR